jgi:N-methylhydantoinase B
MEFQIRLRSSEALSSVLGDRGRYPPYGLHGGHDAEKADVEYTLEGVSYRPEHVTKDEGIRLVAGDTARIATAGGGGWGDPLTRSPSRVLRDVSFGYFSVDRARSDYGVVLRQTTSGFEVDEEATLRERGARKPLKAVS